MNKHLILAILLFAMGIVYTIAFICFNKTKANLSRENVNRKSLNFWTILTFCLSYFCFIADVLLIYLLK